MSDIKSKAQGLDPNVQPRDVGELVGKTGNIYESIAIVGKRARQISSDLKWEIQRKLEEFAVNTDTIEQVDLSDHETFRAGFPHAFFGWLRQQDPVHWHEPTQATPDGEGFWVVSRHADVKAVQMDATTFSSDRGGISLQ